jgi:hypothetical protein
MVPSRGSIGSPGAQAAADTGARPLAKLSTGGSSPPVRVAEVLCEAERSAGSGPCCLARDMQQAKPITTGSPAGLASRIQTSVFAQYTNQSRGPSARPT